MEFLWWLIAGSGAVAVGAKALEGKGFSLFDGLNEALQNFFSGKDYEDKQKAERSGKSTPDAEEVALEEQNPDVTTKSPKKNPPKELPKVEEKPAPEIKEEVDALEKDTPKKPKPNEVEREKPTTVQPKEKKQETQATSSTQGQKSKNDTLDITKYAQKASEGVYLQDDHMMLGKRGSNQQRVDLPDSIKTIKIGDEPIEKPSNGWHYKAIKTMAEKYIKNKDFSDLVENYKANNISYKEFRIGLNDYVAEGHRKIPYGQTDDKLFVIDDYDKDGDVRLIYTRREATSAEWNNGNNGVNREHIWPKGLYSDHETMKSDLYGIYLSDVSTNRDRDQAPYTEGTENHSEAKDVLLARNPQGKIVGWEPPEEVKGDIARALMYMAVRYDGENREYDLEFEGSGKSGAREYFNIATLMSWHKGDPVSKEEIQRNTEISKEQGNTNAFVTNPELVELTFEEQAKKQRS